MSRPSLDREPWHGVRTADAAELQATVAAIDRDLCRGITTDTAAAAAALTVHADRFRFDRQNGHGNWSIVEHDDRLRWAVDESQGVNDSIELHVQSGCVKRVNAPVRRHARRRTAPNRPDHRHLLHRMNTTTAGRCSRSTVHDRDLGGLDGA